MASFIDQRSYEGSASTERYYRDQLERVLVPWLLKHGVTSLDDVSNDLMRTYLKAQRDATFTRFGQPNVIHRLSRGSLIHRYESARTFFRWCVADGRLAHSPMENLGRPRPERRILQPFTAEEARALVQQTSGAHGNLRFRDRAITLILLGAGPRASGLLGMSLTCTRCRGSCVELASTSGRPRVAHGGKVVFHEKGGKDVRSRLGAPAREALNDWLGRVPQIPGGWIWVTQRNTRMGINTLEAMLFNLGKFADVDHVHPHRFRHTFATEFTKSHGNVKATQLRLGHEKIQTTETYLRSLGVEYALDERFQTPDTWLAGPR